MTTGDTHEVTHSIASNIAEVIKDAEVTTVEWTSVVTTKEAVYVDGEQIAKNGGQEQIVIKPSRHYRYTYSFLWRTFWRNIWNDTSWDNTQRLWLNIKADVRRKVKRWVN